MKTSACLLTASLLAVTSVAGGAVGSPQKPTAADIAAKMNGSWTLNKALSPSLDAPPSEGRGRRGGGALFALAAPQRGGGRGGGGGGGASGPEPANIMPEEVAAQAALAVLQQVALEFRIEATPAAISFIEPRGQWDFKIDGKNTNLPVPGGVIRVKSRWDRDRLRQEFSSTQRSLIKAWAIDGDGRLVLTEHVESLAFNSKESKAVYDRR